MAKPWKLDKKFSFKPSDSDAKTDARGKAMYHMGKRMNEYNAAGYNYKMKTGKSFYAVYSQSKR